MDVAKLAVEMNCMMFITIWGFHLDMEQISRIHTLSGNN
jgi:hypothetical protein